MKRLARTKKRSSDKLTRALKERDEALAFQAATEDILTAISRSTSDAKPVFETIVRSVPRLFDTRYVAVFLLQGEELHLAAAKADVAFERRHAAKFRRFQESFPQPIHWGGFTGKALRSGKVSQIGPIIGNPKASPQAVKIAKEFGYDTMLVAPLMRDGKAIGAIGTTRPGVKLFSAKELALFKAFAAQAVIAIENARLFNETKEALEQQTATAEILKVISASPTSTQPVFESIVNNCGVLFKDSRVALWQISESRLLPRASTGYMPEPMPLDRQSAVGACVLDARTIHFADLGSAAEQHPRIKQLGLKHGYLSGVFAPLMREGQAIGAISVLRRELGAFSDKEVALLGTFADQAVIAIENARLFNETKEALERQTAISDILRVISGSPADVKPVLDTVAAHAARICHAQIVDIALAEGPTLRIVASFGVLGAVLGQELPLDRSTVSGRAIVDRVPVHVADIQQAGNEFPLGSELAHKYGYRTILGVPLLREGRALGAILVRRAEVRPSEDKDVALLKTFADQAAIAIENVRLFNETKEALEQQTATADILRVISGTPSDTRPVFEAIVHAGLQVFAGAGVGVVMADADRVRVVAAAGVLGPMATKVDMPRSRESASGTAIVDGVVVNIRDTEASDAPLYARENGRALGFRAIAAAPMLREGKAIGAIGVVLRDPGGLNDKQISLLKTFADQAVIAIENARLFNETREALEQQTAAAEILKVISASPSDVQPVFDAVAANAARVCGVDDVAILRTEGGDLRRVAHYGTVPVTPDSLVPVPPGSVNERVLSERRTLHIPDTAAPSFVGEFPGSQFPAMGVRSLLATPLVHEGVAVGVIHLRRSEARPFTEKQIAMLETFADQAVIAIENVRLFKELQERTEALSKSVNQLTALGEVGQAISSTLELDEVLRTIVQRAVQLAGLDGGSIYEFDAGDERFHLRAAENIAEEILAINRNSPTRLGEGVVGRAGATREPVVVEDVLDERYRSRVRELLIKSGSRALLAVPLLREELLLGALVVSRKSPGPFAPEVIELLKTFATQSAVAIQNARLFREIAEKSSQLEEASRHKSQFLASMSHELRTPLNAILGFNEMILGQVYGEVPSDMKEPLEDIQKSGKHLLRLINNVLDLAKIEAGKMELSLADYSVHDTVESVRSTLRPLAEAKGLELVVSVPEDLPLAYGDGGRLTQCLMNLAGNSLKFTKEGKVEIAVEAENGCLRWRVSDTGIGIPADKIPMLFSEFKQTDATIASEYGGTGLGLSITKKFVEMHGGRIWVESKLGKGSVFTLEIPLRVTGLA